MLISEYSASRAVLDIGYVFLCFCCSVVDVVQCCSRICFLQLIYGEVGPPRHVEKWEKIPVDVDILISHSPPYSVHDRDGEGERAGCKDLLELVSERIKPRVHVFGHIHEAYGVSTNGQTIFINAASPKFPWSKHELNKPIVFEIDIRT